MYDQTGCINLSTCQNIGHRTSMTDGAGSEAWAYEVDKTNLRSVHQEQRTTNSSPNNITKTTTYYLDLAGNVTQLVYPTGRTVNYTYDSADRPSTAADSSNGITYATDWKTTGSGCLASAVCYTPQGSIYNMSLGQTSSFNGLNLFESFNNRLQPFLVSAGTGTAISTSVTSASYPGCTSGSVCPVTFNVASSSGIRIGDTITVSGDASFFNQTWTVTSVSTGQVKSSSSATAAASGSGGTLTDDTSPADNDIDIMYSFVDPVTLKNAGHLSGITNNVSSSRGQAFTYDQLNRIVSAG